MNILHKSLALVLLASSSAAFAGTDFDELDVNGDGYLSLQEASMGGISATKFVELDVNEDGKLSEDEFDNA